MIVLLDSSISHWLYAIREQWLVLVFMGVSELASTITIIALSAILAILLAYRRRWNYVAGLAISIGVSGIITYALKEIIARTRPVGIAAYIENGFSFPSGHATFVVAFYGFILWMLWMVFEPRQKKIAAIVFTALVILVGFSRLYLGVHYLSDVLAGFAVGGIFKVRDETGKDVRGLRRFVTAVDIPGELGPAERLPQDVLGDRLLHGIIQDVIRI